MRARLVTLTSDIGAAYAAQVKGALLRTLAPSRIVEIAHDLPAHGIAEAAFLLRHIGATFPAGTVHLAIVDPGVGGTRAPIAIACREGSRLVGPDNGLLAPLAEHLGVATVVRLDPARVGRAGRVSATFEGRDLFAPAAARLANGTRVERLGRPVRLTPLARPAIRAVPGGTRGSVVHIDRFGNAITDLPPKAAPAPGTRARVRLGRRRLILPRVRTYEEVARGRPLLLVSSFGLLELAIREGDAHRQLRLKPGDPVVVSSGPVRSS
jgi:S-adenosyl-L-methionine hydrolase (adenosine-forming)